MSESPKVILWAGGDSDIADMLTSGGWDVRVFDDTEDLKALLAEKRPQAAVVRLSGTIAEKMVEALRAVPGGTVLPILVVGTEESRVKSPVDAVSILGADSFVSHKEGADRIVRVLSRLVGRSGEPQPREASAAEEPVLEKDSGSAAAPVNPEQPAQGIRVSDDLKEVIRRIEGRLQVGRPKDVPAGPAVMTTDAEESTPGQEITRETPKKAPAKSPWEENVLPDEGGKGERSRKSLELAPTVLNQEGDITQEYPAGSIPPDVAPMDEEAERVTAFAGLADRLSPDTPASGRVEEVPVPVLLALSMALRISGRIDLVRGGIRRLLYLSEGQPILASSEAAEDRLVELLRMEGRLSERQYQTQSRLVTESGRRVGVLMVEQGIIKPRELFPLVRRHYEEILFRCFAWSDGEWRYEPSIPPVGERIKFDLPAGALIIEGVRRKLGGALSLHALGGQAARPLRESGGGLCSLDEAGLLPEEQHVVELCDGVRTLDEIAVSADRPLDDVSAIVLGLFYLGHVSLEHPLQLLEPDRGDEEPPRQILTQARKIEPRDALLERARIEEKLAVVREGTYFAVLGVPPYATPHEVRQAYRQVRRELSVERFLNPELQDLVPMAEEVLFVVEEAYEILRDPDLRESYRRSCGE